MRMKSVAPSAVGVRLWIVQHNSAQPRTGEGARATSANPRICYLQLAKSHKPRRVPALVHVAGNEFRTSFDYAHPEPTRCNPRAHLGNITSLPPPLLWRNRYWVKVGDLGAPTCMLAPAAAIASVRRRQQQRQKQLAVAAAALAAATAVIAHAAAIAAGGDRCCR